MRSTPVQVGGAGLAVMDSPKRGIQFGAEGLSIPFTQFDDQEKIAKCRLGTYYAKNSALSEGGRSLFAVGESHKGTELMWLQVRIWLTLTSQDSGMYITCLSATVTAFPGLIFAFMQAYVAS